MNFDGFYSILELVGYLIRPIGVLVFGVAVGWMAVKAVRLMEEAWQVFVAVFLGLLATFVLLTRWVEGGGTLGLFGLGAGAAMLIWGFFKKGDDEEA
jgi:uncharacterized membrane protein (DUF441 family)